MANRTSIAAPVRPPPSSARPERISVIIPVLNEEARIARRLRELAAMPTVTEIIVVDGGSQDTTVAVAGEFPCVEVLKAPRGRAVQMNHGAEAATGDVMLFLHADVALPADAERWIEEALSDEAVVAGAFRTWTVPDMGPHWLAPFLHIGDIRSRYSSLPYGDQALFVRAEAFGAAGGFPEIPIMEDLEFARSLQRLGRIRTVRGCVKVSGRRFLAHPIYFLVVMNTLPALYWLGVPVRLLAALYHFPKNKGD